MGCSRFEALAKREAEHLRTQAEKRELAESLGLPSVPWPRPSKSPGRPSRQQLWREKVHDAIERGTLPEGVAADPRIWWHPGQALVLNEQKMTDEVGAIPVFADGNETVEVVGDQDPPEAAAGSVDPSEVPAAKKRKAKKTLDTTVKT
eukprot:879755-Amphidinium_carterae.1